MYRQDSAYVSGSTDSYNHTVDEEVGPVIPETILSGLETRTNVMVKNIPCRYKKEEI